MVDPADCLSLRLLVLRCQVGDRASFAALVAHFQPRLRGFVYNMVPRRGASHLDDLTQDVWADVLRDLSKLTDAGAFGPWLYRVARNRVYRATRQRPPAAEAIDDVDMADPRESAEPFTEEDAAAVH